jgi:hypothetical protein
VVHKQFTQQLNLEKLDNMAQGTTKGVPIDIDPTLAADSDLLVPSQKAVKAYVNNQYEGLVTAAVTHYSSSTTLDIADYIVWAGNVSNAVILTLPALSSVQHGKTYIIKRLSGNSVTVNKNVADPNFDLPGTPQSSISLTDNKMVKVVAWKNPLEEMLILLVFG